MKAFNLRPNAPWKLGHAGNTIAFSGAAVLLDLPLDEVALVGDAVRNVIEARGGIGIASAPEEAGDGAQQDMRLAEEAQRGFEQLRRQIACGDSFPVRRILGIAAVG